MDMVHPEIEAYLDKLFPSTDKILGEMEKLAAERDFPIVGPLVGRLLALLAAAVRARRIYEFGSGFGYSAFWFAKGMEGSGELILTDDDPENAREAREFLKRGFPEGRYEAEIGDAVELIDRTTGSFDIVFIDCDKKRYPVALEKALPKVRKGGLIIADNVLWSGSVLKPSEDPSDVGIQTFNRMISEHPDLQTTVIPLRDGVSVSLKR
jgi:caffeoyl-CoA O-methyltransferase